MRQNTLLRIATLSLIVIAATVNTVWPRLPMVKARVLPIDNLPRVLGGWQNTADNPMDMRTRQSLPEARLLSRTYRDAVGHSAELMLESSPNEGEYHLPSYCMPAQGWSIVKNEAVKVGGMDATELHIETAQNKAVMLFWYVADPASMAQNSLLAKFASDRNPTRLFVRVTAPVTLNYDTTSHLAHQFADVSVPALSSLIEPVAPAPSSTAVAVKFNEHESDHTILENK